MRSESTGLLLNNPPVQLRWPYSLPGREVECAPGILRTVCMEAADGMRTLAKGGLEVGGVLFGTQEEELVRIVAARPIECEHRFGPSFVLSEKDDSLLAQMLADFRKDRRLASLEPLGCYLSHPRHGRVLTDRDLDLYRRHFAETIQLALILTRRSLRSMYVDVIGRNAEGIHVGCHEFEYYFLGQPSRETVRTELPIPGRRSNAPPKLDVEIVPVASPPVLGPVANPAPTLLSPARREIVRTGPQLGVEIITIAPTPVHGRVKDPPSRVVRRIAGNTPKAFRRARLILALLILTVCAPRPDVPISLGPKPETTPRREPKSPPRLELERSIEVKAPNAGERNSVPPARNNPATPALSAAKEVSAQKDPPRSFRPPVVRTVRTSNLNSTPAIIPDPPPLRESVVGASPSVPSLPAFRLPAPSPAPVPDARAPAAPASGRLIWTGQLAKGAVISLTSKGASIGYLNGWIPPKTPVHLEVRPGELITGGIVVYTKDPNSRSEPPSAGNGWNTVIYRQDYVRASDLRVLEAPGAGNDWNQLVLQNGDRKLSLIVLDWRSTK
jgi:hypothetical protein